MINNPIVTLEETIVEIDDNDNVQIIIAGIPGPPGVIEVTTIGSSGPSTLIDGVLNVPIYTGGGVSSVPGFRKVTASTNMTLADYTVEGDTTASSFTINLPDSTTAYNATTHTGQIFNVAKPIAANQLTVGSVNSSDRINGNVTVTFLLGNLQVQAGPNNTYTVL